jgi:hypothetical protein
MEKKRMIKKQGIKKTLISATVIALILLSTIALNTPSASAADYPTYLFLTVQPNAIGVGQDVT